MTPPTDWKNALQHIADDAMREALGDLVDRIVDWASENEAGLVVLVSRRMCCIYEMALSAGLLPPRCEVVYDRVLDGSELAWNGRQVLLVDDAVAFGSTITDRYDDICRLVGDDTRVAVDVAVFDTDRRSSLLIARLGLGSQTRPLGCTEKQITELARNVATCLYRSLTPYFTDFPLLRPLSIAKSEFDDLLRSNDWLTFDVTAPILAGADEHAYSMLPSAQRRDRLTGTVFAEVADLLSIIKIRLWSRPSISDADTLEVRLVPIVVPSAMMMGPLIDALASIESQLHVAGDTSLVWDDWKPQAKHRLFQMYLSTCLLADFERELLAHCPSSATVFNSDSLVKSHVVGYFGDKQVDPIRRAFDLSLHGARELLDGPPSGPTLTVDLGRSLDSRGALSRLPQVRSHLLTKLGSAERGGTSVPAAPAMPSTDEVGRLDPLWVQRVIDTFGFVDTDLERPQQEALRAKLDEACPEVEAAWNSKLEDHFQSTYALFRAQRLAGFGDRILKMGLMIRDLNDFIVPPADADEPWTAEATSLAIDVANDLGVAVPSTVCINGGREDLDERMKGPVYRHYRSGENAPVAQTPIRKLVGLSTHDALERCDDLTLAALDIRSRRVNELDKEALGRFEEFLRTINATEGVTLRSPSVLPSRQAEPIEWLVGEVRSILGSAVECDLYDIVSETSHTRILRLGDFERPPEIEGLVRVQTWKTTDLPMVQDLPELLPTIS